jgi:hypothetical protein
LKAVGVSVTNQRCGSYSAPEMVVYAGGPSTEVLVEIGASQLPTALAAGFVEISTSNLQYYKDTFDCASRNL